MTTFDIVSVNNNKLTLSNNYSITIQNYIVSSIRQFCFWSIS